MRGPREVATGCEKRAYATKDAAKRVIRAGSHWRQNEVHAYCCADCGHFHVGHKLGALDKKWTAA